MGSLKELYHVQEISNRIRELGEQQAALKADVSVTQIKSRLSQVTVELASIEEAISVLKKKINHFEGLNAEEKGKRQQCEKKLYDGSTVNPKELSQLQQKIDEYQEMMDNNDEKTLQLWEELEPKEQAKATVQREKDQLSADLKVLKQERQARNSQLEMEIASLQREMEEAKKAVPDDLLQLFEKMARTHHGVAMAPLKGDGCGACHVALSSGTLHTLRKSQDGYIRCENCGRMVFIL
jgi:predicted  nucleic acid-binding Zn-ribbon protein